MFGKIIKGYELVTVENQNDQNYNTAWGENGFLFFLANNSREFFLTIKIKVQQDHANSFQKKQ